MFIILVSKYGRAPIHAFDEVHLECWVVNIRATTIENICIWLATDYKFSIQRERRNFNFELIH